MGMRHLQTLEFDIGQNYDDSDEGEPNETIDEDLEDEVNASNNGVEEESMHLMLQGSDTENEDELECNDGTSLYIDVYAHRELLEDDGL